MSEPLSPDQLAEIAARAEAATPGPWRADSSEIYQGDDEYKPDPAWIGETCRADDFEGSRADAAFIAAARTDVPALLAEVDRLRACNAKLERVSDEALSERDALHDRLDEMAAAVAPIEEIGEHSSHNDPWQNALDLLAAPAARLSRAGVLREAAAELRALQAQYRAAGHHSDANGLTGGIHLLRALAAADEGGEERGAEDNAVCPVCTSPPCHCSCFGKEPRRDCPHQAAREVGAWNEAHPVGTRVAAYPGCRPEDAPDCERLDTVTRSQAWVLGGHTPVVMVDGHSGGIALTHIDAIAERGEDRG
jgi:hypothetical protein